MPILSLRKDKKEDAKVAEVPDELPSLSEPEVPKPQAKAEQTKPTFAADTLPKLEPEPIKRQPVDMRAAPMQPVSPPEPVQPIRYDQPVPEVRLQEKPKKLIDHINLIDELKEQLSITELELNQLTDTFFLKKRLLQELKQRLDDEVAVVKLELGLESAYEQKKNFQVPAEPIEKPAEKPIARETAAPVKDQKQLFVVQPERYFYFGDGTYVKSILELSQKLETISDDAFSQYCNPWKNDFYLWVRDVFADRYLAESMRTVTSRRETISLLKIYLQQYG